MSSGVEITRSMMETPAGKQEAWTASFDGTTATSSSREHALKQLVVAVAKEGPL